MQEFPGTAHGQVAVPHPSQGHHPVGQFLDLLGLAPDDNNLKAVVMVHMDMG